jgi:hypothetical protein
MLNLYLLALPAALWLVWRVRRHGAWLWCFSATFAALLLWRHLGISFGNRYGLFMSFFAQFLLAEVAAMGLLRLSRARMSLKLPFQPSRRDAALLMALPLAAVLAALPSPMLRVALDRTAPAGLKAPLELLKQPSPHDAYYRQYTALAPLLTPADVVMTPTTREVFDLAAITGARFVSAPGAIRVPDARERFEAAFVFFQRGVSWHARVSLLGRYRATKVLLPSTHAGLYVELTQQLGPPTYRSGQLALFEVPSAPTLLL